MRHPQRQDAGQGARMILLDQAAAGAHRALELPSVPDRDTAGEDHHAPAEVGLKAIQWPAVLMRHTSAVCVFRSVLGSP